MWWKRITMPLMIALMLCVSKPAHAGPEVSWVPVRAIPGSHSWYETPFELVPMEFGTATDGTGESTEIRLLSGSAYRIEFEIRINGWGDWVFDPKLGSYNIMLSESGLLGVNATPPNPGVDLTQYPRLHAVEEALISLQLCHFAEPPTLYATGQVCDLIGDESPPPCPLGQPCLPNVNYVFDGILDLAIVVSARPYFTWAAGVYPGSGRDDEGASYYAGTLRLTVPAEATGRYTVDFELFDGATYLNDSRGGRISYLTRTSGQVTLGTACCLPGGTCSFMTEAECTLAGGDSLGVFCEGDVDGDGLDGVCGDPCPLDNPDDTDGDGSCDSDDLCPGFDDNVDSDGDGAADGCDPCPNDYADDSDGDGVCDGDDGCPLDPTKVEPGICGCGVSDEKDADADSVPDCLDQCPGVDDAVFAPECAAAIPTVSGWGIVVLTLLLMVGGKVYFRDRRGSAVNPT